MTTTTIKPLRLFCLRHGRNGPVVRIDGEPVYFNNKMAAKAARDKLEDAVVSFGPDHKLYQEVK